MSAPRQRHRAAVYDPEAFKKAQFERDMALGGGDPLSAWPTWAVRVKAWEDDLRLLHRLVLRRDGRAGERHAALAGFCGLVEGEEVDATERVGKLTVSQLQGIITTFSVPVTTRSHAGRVAAVVAFLMKPTVPQPAKTPEPRKRVAAAALPVKAPRTEGKVLAVTQPSLSRTASGQTDPARGAAPSDDSVALAVFRCFLAMSPADRSASSLSALRGEVEARLACGSLKERKDTVRDAVVEVGALLVASAKAAAGDSEAQ